MLAKNASGSANLRTALQGIPYHRELGAYAKIHLSL